ncbi:MAG: DUF2934 domain-containing protein [Bacteroidales bacterium]
MSADQEIKDLAYKLWQDAGSPDGRDQEFWYAAEVQVKAAKPAKAKAAAPKASKPKAAPKPKAAAAPKPKAKAAAKA